MPSQTRWGREARRTRREEARALAKELVQEGSAAHRWGFILTFWGTVASVAGVAVGVTSQILASTLFTLAFAQIIVGLWFWKKLSRRSKWMLSTLAVGLFALFQWQFIHRATGVSVYPTIVNFDSVNVGDGYVFKATNNTDDDLYTVALRLDIDPPNALDPTDFRFSFPENSRKFLAASPQYGDTIGFYCRSGRDRPLLLVSIYRMLPHESREFLVKRLKQKSVKMTAKAVYSSAEPKPVVATGPFTMPPPPPRSATDFGRCYEFSFYTDKGEEYSGNAIGIEWGPNESPHLKSDKLPTEQGRQ
jgi:heme/copper-type cytochrome/quinol oxidase subunit 4